MAEKKHEQSSFTVTDRRLFTSDGELRSDAPEQEVEVRTPAPPSPPAAASAEPTAPPLVATDSDGAGRSGNARPADHAPNRKRRRPRTNSRLKISIRKSK